MGPDQSTCGVQSLSLKVVIESHFPVVLWEEKTALLPWYTALTTQADSQPQLHLNFLLSGHW